VAKSARAKSDPRPTVVVYGNCQADATASIFNRDPGFSERFRAIFFPGYDHPTKKAEHIPREDLAACAVLLEQHDQVGFTQRDLLPPDVRVVKFPSLDFNLFWPFNTVNPFNSADPGKPIGLFPYGDRVIIGCVKKGMQADEIFDYYMSGWDEYKVDLHRLAALETARIASRDARSNVKLGALILQHFHTQRLFWTVNHPTADLLTDMTGRLLTAAFPNQAWAQQAHLRETILAYFSPLGPLGSIDVPIHPGVAAHLKLSWYDFDEKHRLSDGRAVSYGEYFHEMIKVSVERHAEGSTS